MFSIINLFCICGINVFYILCSIKKGGTNPTSNTILAAVLEKARVLDVPKEIVERNMKKASEKGQEDFIEKFYEVGGFTYPDPLLSRLGN